MVYRFTPFFILFRSSNSKVYCTLVAFGEQVEFCSLRTGGTFFWTSRVRFSSQGGSHCRLIRDWYAVWLENPTTSDLRESDKSLPLWTQTFIGLLSRTAPHMISGHPCFVHLGHENEELHVTVGWSQMDFKEQCWRIYDKNGTAVSSFPGSGFFIKILCGKDASPKLRSWPFHV